MYLPCANYKFDKLTIPLYVDAYAQDDDANDNVRVAADEHRTHSPSPKKEWPSHARRRSRKGTGVYCIQQFVTTSSMFKLTDHYEHICFLIGANEGCKKKGVVPSRVYQQP